METYYIGFDIHKKTISFCMKKSNGDIIQEGKIIASRPVLQQWAEAIPVPWIGAMEATIFTGWIYEFLKPYGKEIKVAHPQMLKAISAAKKKNDSIDARMICDLLRCDLLPECYMVSAETRELRRTLRYRNHIVREAVRMQNKISGLLMECGAQYSKRRLHGKKYFNELMENLEDIPDSVKTLLSYSRAGYEMFTKAQKQLVRALRDHTALKERVTRLMTIPGIGEISALTWALEIDDPHRFKSIGKAVSYCGLCSAENSSADKEKRGPISKQRNKHLQTILIEAAKLAPHWNIKLAEVYAQEKEKGSRNQATIAVARKLVAYMLAVDKSRQPFLMEAQEKNAA